MSSLQRKEDLEFADYLFSNARWAGGEATAAREWREWCREDYYREIGLYKWLVGLYKWLVSL